MPKKKVQETQAEQSERFKKAVRDMIDAGELSPTDAVEVLDKILVNQRAKGQVGPCPR